MPFALLSRQARRRGAKSLVVSRLTAAVLLALGGGAGGRANAQTYTWTGNGIDGNWTTAGNFTPALTGSGSNTTILNFVANPNGYASNNDQANPYVLNQANFALGLPAFALTGNALQFDGTTPIISIGSAFSGSNIFNSSLSFGNAITFNSATTVNNNAAGVSVTAAPVAFTGNLTFNAGLTLNQGRYVFAGTNTGTAAVTLNSGAALTLDYTTNAGSKLPGGLATAGGTLYAAVPSSTVATQYAVNGLAANVGFNTVTFGSPSTTNELALGTITRSAGGFVNFNRPTGGTITTANTNTNNILGGWATTSGDWATVTTVNGLTNGIGQYSGYVLATATALGATADNVRVNIAAVGVSGAQSINSLKLDTIASTLSLASGTTLAIGSGGILQNFNGTTTISTPSGTATISSGTGEIVYSSQGGGGTTIASGVTFSGSPTLTVANSNGTLTLASTNTLADVNVVSGTLALGATNQTVSGNVTIKGGGLITGTATPGITLAATSTVTLEGTGTNTVLFGGGGASAALVKNGPATAVLNGASPATFATLTINDGTLSVGALAATGTAQPLGASAAALTIGGATTPGTFQVNANSTQTTNRPIVVGAGGGVIDSIGGTSAVITLSATGQITGAGNLTKAGIGNLTISGANTGFTGSTVTLLNGTLTLGDAQSLGSATIAFTGTPLYGPGGGRLASAVAPNTTVAPLTFTNAFSGVPAFGGANAFTLGGNFALTSDAAIFSTNVGAAGTGPSSTPYAAGTTLSGVISGAFNLSTQAGVTGFLTLTGPNTLGGTGKMFTYNGNTVSLLTLGNATAFGDANTTFVWNGGLLGATGALTTANYAQQWNGGQVGFIGANALNLGAGAVALGTDVMVVNSSSGGATVGGVISGANSLSVLVPNGSTVGTLTLTGANTFGGAGKTLTFGSNPQLSGLQLAGGTVVVGNAAALGNAANTVVFNGPTTLNAAAGGAALNAYAMQWNADVTFGGTNALNTGTGAVTLGFYPGVYSATRTITASNTAGATVGGAIGGGAGGPTNLTIGGTAGVLTLAGGGTYTGITNVTGTTTAVTVNLTGPLASTLVNVNSLATLVVGAGGNLADAATVNVTNSGGTFTVNSSDTIGTLNSTSAGAINVNAGATLTLSQFSLQAGGTIGGTGTISQTGGTFDLRNGTVVPNLAGAAGIGKTSTNGVTLRGANTFTGASTLSLGTLTLDYSTSTAAKLGNGAALNLGGGILSFTTSTTTSTAETLGGLNLVGGNGYLNVTATSPTVTNTLNLGAITRTAPGQTLRFGIATGATVNTTTTNTNGILGGWAYNGNNFAAVNGSGVVGTPAYTQATASGLGAATANSQISGTIAPVLTSDATINSIHFNGSAAGTLDLGGNTLTVTSGGFLQGVNQAFTYNNGSLTTTGPDLVFITNASTTTNLVTVNATIVDGGLNSVAVTKTGTTSTPLVLSAANTYTGGTFVAAGVLNATNTGALGSGAVRLFNGVTLALINNGTGSAGTITYGNSLVIDPSATSAIVSLSNPGANTGNTVQLGGLTLGNSISALGQTLTVNGGSGYALQFTGPATLVGNATVNPTATGNPNVTLSGAISDNGGGYSLTVNNAGTGTVTLGGNNSFSGGFTNTAGVTVLANAGALNAATPNVVVPTAGIISLNGNSVTVAGLNGGSGTINDNNATAATLTINTPTNLNPAGAALTSAAILANGAAGTLSVVKAGPGAQTLTGASTATGTVTVAGGSLLLATNAGLGTSATGGFFLGDGGTANALPAVLGTTSALTLTAPITVNPATGLVTLSGGGGVVATINSSITLNNTLRVGGPNSTTVGGTTSANIVSGTGGIYTTGINSTTLGGTASNTYTGLTVVKVGTLQLAKTGAAVVAVPGDLVVGNGFMNAAVTYINTATTQLGANKNLTINQYATFTAGTASTNETVNTLTLNALVSPNGFAYGAPTFTAQQTASTFTVTSLVDNGGSVNLGAATTGTTLTVGSVTMTGGTIQNNATSGLNTVNLTGNFASNASSAVASFGATTGTTNTLALGSTSHTFNAAAGTTLAGVDVVVGFNAVTGTGGITLGGPGVVQLPFISAGYSGGVTLNGGTLLLAGSGGSTQFGTGPLTLNGGTLATNGGNTVPAAVAVTITNASGPVTLGAAPYVIPNATRNNYFAKNLTINGAGATILAGAVTMTANPTVLVNNPSNVTISGIVTAANGFTAGGGVTLANASYATGSNVVTVTSTAGLGVNNLVVGPNILGGTAVTGVLSDTQFTINQNPLATVTGQSLTANAFLILSNSSNSISSGLNINNGLVQFSADAQLGATTTPVNLSNGGVLDYNTNTAITTTRVFNVGTGGGTLSFRSNTITLATAGQLTGTAATLNKTGAGTLTISNANTGFTGTVNVYGGTLTAQTVAGALNTAAVNVFSGALYNHNIAGATTGVVTVNSGGQATWNQNKTAAEATPVIAAGGIIRGSSAVLQSFTQGTNITLADGAVISSTTNVGTATALIGNLGTTPRYYFGVGVNPNTSAVTVGANTPWVGLSSDRSTAVVYSGAFTVGSAASSVTLQSEGNILAFNPSGSSVAVTGGGSVAINVVGVGGSNGLGGSVGGYVRLDLTTPIANVSQFNVLAGGTLRANATNTINNAVVVQAGGEIDSALAAGLTGTGAITFQPGSILNVSNAGGLTGTQVTPAGIPAGVIVRLNLNADIANVNNLNPAATIELANNNYNLTNGGSLTLSGGTVTNDFSSRSVNNANNPILIGSGGVTFAATTGTTLTMGNAIASAAGTVTIGSAAPIDGLPKLGIVDYQPASVIFGATVNVVAGASLQSSNGALNNANVTFNGGGSSLIIPTNTSITVGPLQTLAFNGNNLIAVGSNSGLTVQGTFVNNGGTLTITSIGSSVAIGQAGLGASNPNVSGTIVLSNAAGAAPTLTALSGSTIPGRGPLGIATVRLIGSTLALQADQGEVFGNSVETSGVVTISTNRRTTPGTGAGTDQNFSINMGALTVTADTVLNATASNNVALTFTQTNVAGGNLVINGTSGAGQIFMPGALNDGGSARTVTAAGNTGIILNAAAASFGSTSSYVVNNGVTNLNVPGALGAGKLVVNSGTVNVNAQNGLAGLASITLGDETATLNITAPQTTTASLVVNAATTNGTTGVVLVGGNVNQNGWAVSVGSASIAAGGQVNALAVNTTTQLGGFTVTTGPLNGAGAVSGPTTIAGTATLGGTLNVVGNLTYNTSGTSSFGGLLNGAVATLALPTTNVGTLALTGANTYGGTTTVAGGTLLANNTTGSATGLAAVAVTATGTLGGTGSVGGATTVGAGGTVRGGIPGGVTNATGTLTVANTLTLTPAGVLGVDFGGGSGTANSKLTVTGATLGLVPTGGQFVVQLLNDGGLTLNNPYTITLATVPTGTITAAGLTIGANGTVPAADYTLSSANFSSFTDTAMTVDGSGQLLQLTFTPAAAAVPEPATVGLLTALGLGLGRLVRRGRRRADY